MDTTRLNNCTCILFVFYILCFLDDAVNISDSVSVNVRKIGK